MSKQESDNPSIYKDYRIFLVRKCRKWEIIPAAVIFLNHLFPNHIKFSGVSIEGAFFSVILKKVVLASDIRFLISGMFIGGSIGIPIGLLSSFRGDLLQAFSRVMQLLLQPVWVI